jgi:hypothetical protein
MASPSTNPISPPSNYGQFITVKLTRDNYLLWQAQIMPYLWSQRLLGYVSSTMKCPLKTLLVTESNVAPIPNLVYDLWFEQDQAIISALFSSLSLEVLSHCLFLKTLKEVWEKLHDLYAAQSQASAMQLWMQLATMKKNELSAIDYFNQVKNLADNLAAAGAPLRLLTGLPEEYDSLVTSVATWVELMSLSKVYTNLLSFEVCLVNCNAPPPPSHGHTMGANYASRGGRGSRHTGRSGGRFGGRTGGHSGGRNNNNNAGDRNTMGDRPRC